MTEESRLIFTQRKNLSRHPLLLFPRCFAPLSMTVAVKPLYCHPERSEGSRPALHPLGSQRYNILMRQYFVYIMTNASKTLYIGVTNDLMRRVTEHKNGQVKGFTSKYHITKLVYYEQGDNIETAISREKQLKGWLRSRKIALIESVNPQWRDLSEDWKDD